MSQSKDRGDNIRQHAIVVVPRVSLEAGARRTGLGRKADGLLHSQGRKVHVVLRTVLDVASVVVRDLLRS